MRNGFSFTDDTVGESGGGSGDSSTRNDRASSSIGGGGGGRDDGSPVPRTASSTNHIDNASSVIENKMLRWPTLRHLGKQNEHDLAIDTIAPRCFWPRQYDDNRNIPPTPANLPLRSDAFLGYWVEPGENLDMCRPLEQNNADIGIPPCSPHEDMEKTSIDSVLEGMDDHTLDSCILRGYINTRNSYSDNDGGSNNDGDSDDSSGIYEMPEDRIDELTMELYGCNLHDPMPRQSASNKPSTKEANLQRELSIKDQELSELNNMVESLNAEMLVQKSELEAADRKMSQLEASLQCSICLEPFSQPHSLGCGHTFCMECLKQWLAQSMQCPTCRSSALQRPSVAFIIQDVLQCLGIGDECQPSSTEAIRRGENQDPWQQLFPTQSSGNASGSYERCRVCTRWTLRGGACPHCDLERIRRRLASSINVEGSTPRQSPSINMSRLTRRPGQVLSRVERLIESARNAAREYNTASTPRSERSNAAPPSSEQRRPSLLVIRRSEFETTPPQSPPEPLFDPAELLQRRRTNYPRPSSRSPATSTPMHSRLDHWQPGRQANNTPYLDSSSTAGSEHGSRDLSFYRNRYEESLLSPVSARASGFSLPSSDTRRSLRGYSTAESRSRGNEPFASDTIASTSNAYPIQDDMSYNRVFNSNNPCIPSRTQNSRVRSPSDYYVLRLDDNDSTTDEGEPPAPSWYRRS
ncbi:E3 ubiquitin ligase [Coemansia sp. RSA 1646]|nr:E3 ubiquitin ligase [Coemansia sp. RSA 1646]KAJ2090903.1 E3 ubiquitin ligase [Coemansia sp. RSA 986]